jgi:hypothetical protein
MVRIPDETFDDLVPRQDVDVSGLIIRYENVELAFEDEIILFQELVNSGLAWSLQGSYGRRAVELIKRGLVDDPRPNVGQ